MKTAPKTKPHPDAPLSEETLDALEEFGTVLKTIYLRLKNEGYRIIDGRLVNINQHEQGDTDITKHPQSD